MKAEKERIEAKVFRSGQNWKPTPTVPRTPKISVPVVKGERNFESNVKSLSKPVNSIRKQLNADSALGDNDAQMLLTEMNGYETLGMPNGSAGKVTRMGGSVKSAAQQQFYQSIQKQNAAHSDVEGLVKIESECTYDQAKNIIHSHILQLDI